MPLPLLAFLLALASGLCAQTESAPRFRDATTRFGLARKGFNASVRIVDLDLDGRLDVLTGGSARLAVFYGGAKVVLSEPWRVSSSGFHPADFDGDGVLDVYVGNFHGRNRLFRGLGGRRFEAVEIAVLADGRKGKQANAADIDGDGDLDLLLGNEKAPYVLYRNDGERAFTDVTPDFLKDTRDDPEGMSSVFLDADGDGDIDLFVMGRLHLNDSKGRFSPAADFPRTPFRSRFQPTFADVDGDGTVDFISGNEIHFLTAKLGVSSVQRLGDAAIETRKVAFDHDNDGDLDILGVTANGPTTIWSNEGKGQWKAHTLKVPMSATRTGQVSGVAVADLDGDGDLDIYRALHAGTNVFAENLTERRTALQIVPLAASGVPAPPGTRVQVYAPDSHTLLASRQVMGFATRAHPSPHPHVALPGRAKADLRVTFPGGAVVTRRGVAVPGKVTVRAPQ